MPFWSQDFGGPLRNDQIEDIAYYLENMPATPYDTAGGPTWKPLVTVRSKTKENVNIMADLRGDKVVGLVIIAAEPREFTIVNIQGPIDIDRLADLSGQFGIPEITATPRRRDRD